MKYIMKLFSICCFIILITSPGMTGIPLEENMSPGEVKARFEEMKRQQQEIARKIWEEKQEKKKEKDMKEQLIERMEAPQPTTKEEKTPAQKEGVKEIGEVEEKIIPSPTGEGAKGLAPGVPTKEEQMEESIKTEKRKEATKEVKDKRDFSFILVIIVMVVTIVFLIRSMFQGKISTSKEKPNDEKKKN